MWQDLPAEVQSGAKLYGNDFVGDQLADWYAAEEKGFFQLGYADQDEAGFDHHAMNALHSRLLGARKFATCLAFGCGTGEDIKALSLQIDRIIAIEPTRTWWSDFIGDTPASFRAPEISGAIDLPDRSVDLVVALGALHHVANVECVIAEFARVLRPGGKLLIREPITSMGDFTEPRPGLTKHERGIPKELMLSFLSAARLTTSMQRYCSVTALSKPLRRLGVRAYDSQFWTWVDARLASILSGNARYWRPRAVDKIAPSSMAYVAEKLA